MERENMKIKREPEIEVRTPNFAILDLEFEKKMIGSQKRCEKQTKEKPSDSRIKREEINDYEESQMLSFLNNKIWELKNQILEQDRVDGAFQIQEETKAAKLEKEIQELKLQKQMDDKIIEEMSNRVSGSEIREKKLTDTVEELRRKISALEEEKKTADLVHEGLRRQRSEAVKAAGVGVKRFENLVPITENLTNLLKISVANLKDMFVCDVAAGTHETKDDGIIEIVDESDEEKEKLGKSCVAESAANDHQTKKRKEPSKNCCHVHRRIFEETEMKKKKMEMASTCQHLSG